MVISESMSACVAYDTRGYYLNIAVDSDGAIPPVTAFLLTGAWPDELEAGKDELEITSGKTWSQVNG